MSVILVTLMNIKSIIKKNKKSTRQNNFFLLNSIYRLGEMSERFKVPVLKTGVGQTTVSSNLTLSAINSNESLYVKYDIASKAQHSRAFLLFGIN